VSSSRNALAQAPVCLAFLSHAVSPDFTQAQPSRGYSSG